MKKHIFWLTQCNIYYIYTWLVLCPFYLKTLSWALFALCHEICNCSFILMPCAAMCPSQCRTLRLFLICHCQLPSLKRHVEWKAGLNLLKKVQHSLPMATMVFLWYATYIHFLPRPLIFPFHYGLRLQSQGSRSSHLNLNEDSWIQFFEYSSSDDGAHEPKDSYLIPQVQQKQNNESSEAEAHGCRFGPISEIHCACGQFSLLCRQRIYNH